MSKRFLLFCFISLLCSLPSFGQENEAWQLNIRKSTSHLTLDGLLDEPAWKEADTATNFFQTFPYDTSFAKIQTQVMVTYDDVYFYVGAICLDPDSGHYVIQSLKRDYSYPISDAFAVYIDPFNDNTNGFSFSVNPLGAQREGLIENGGGFGVTTAWDNKWFSKVTHHADRWVVEMAIPFKTLRYKQDLNRWRINFSRNNLKANEGSAWVPVALNYNIATLAFTGRLNWDNPPPKTGANIAIIPYISGGLSSNYTIPRTDYRYNAGFDAKVVVTPSLNLDVTVNPDFSQIEVDRQVTNLDR
ncbi:MAG: carbohydrate binding family 9 domain-containing protein, partial [Bacteroidia bacterium]|nr:carbohydrate binding family 9 domain-containing protein [Bacteroidia bacterium]